MKKITFLWCLLFCLTATVHAQNLQSSATSTAIDAKEATEITKVQKLSAGNMENVNTTRYFQPAPYNKNTNTALEIEQELLAASVAASSQTGISLDDLLDRYAAMGHQTGKIDQLFTIEEIAALKRHFASQNNNMMANIIPTAGATETFAVVVGDFFYDPSDGVNGGPGGDCTTTSSGNSGDYPNCGCTTTTTLTGVDLEVEFLSFNIFGTFDVLNIYDGPNTASPQIYDSNLNASTDTLAGMIAANGSAVFTSTSGALTFEFSATTVVNTCGWEVEVLPGGGGGGGGCATPLLEVNQDITDACMANISQTDLAQSYIPLEPVSAGAGIHFEAASTGLDVTLSLWDNLPNAGGTMLATGTTQTANDVWTDVFWDPVVNVTPGNTYYIVIEGDVALPCVSGSINNPYPGGNVFANPGYQSFPGFDYTFRTYSCDNGGGGPATAYCAMNSSGEFGSLDPLDGSVITAIGPSGAIDFEGGGAIDPNNPGTAYAMDVAGNFFSVDIATGVYTNLGVVNQPGAESVSGLEFDPVSGTLYMVTTDITTSTLSTIDIGALTSTPIAATGMAGAIALAIDGAGNGWAYDIVDDNFYSVNLATGAATLVGPIGFDANFGQGMGWDPNSDTVYMSAFNNTLFDSEWRSVDTSTGATTLINQMNAGTLTQYAWVSIPSTGPPADNDDCASATAVDCGNTYLGDTSDNTDQGGFDTSPDEWFKYTGPGAGNFEYVTISLCDGGTGYDSRLTVFDSCGGAQVATNDDFCGLQSEVTFTSDGSTTYYIAVEGFGGATGAFSLAVSCVPAPPPPPNDFCANAIEVHCGDFIAGSTIDATIDDAVAPTCDTGVTSPGVWYVLNDNTGLVTDITITMCTGTTDYDSKLSVYTGDCGAPPLTCVVGNDDTCGLQSEVTFQSDGNTTFLILVHGFGGATGNFELDIQCTPIPPPNDDIANSIDIDEIGCPFTDPAVAMPAATVEGGNPQGCNIDGANGVWYNITPAGDGEITATISTPAGASFVNFFTAPDENANVTDLVLVDWWDNQCAPSTSTTIPVVAGQAYYIFVVNSGGITDIVIECDILGVDDNAIAGFSFYPNPANEALNLSSVDIIENVAIFNMLGQKVADHTIEATNSQVNISQLATGTYVMKVAVNGQVGTYKLVKE